MPLSAKLGDVMTNVTALSFEASKEHGRDELRPRAYFEHRATFVVATLLILIFALRGNIFNPLDYPVITGFLILLLGVPHGAFDVAVWTAKNGLRGTRGIPEMLLRYIALAAGFFTLWLVAPAVALPVFLLMSIYHFSGDWHRDLNLVPRLIVAAAMISAPAGLFRAEVVEIFSWLAPDAIATAVGLVMATTAVPLLQASAVVVALHALHRPWAAAEIAVVLALAWLTPPLMFFLIYFCGLHSVRHMIETRHLLGSPNASAFFRAAFPYAALAIMGTLVGAFALSTLPPGPALIGAIFMALGALTVPHIVVVEMSGSPDHQTPPG